MATGIMAWRLALQVRFPSTSEHPTALMKCTAIYEARGLSFLRVSRAAGPVITIPLVTTWSGGALIAFQNNGEDLHLECALRACLDPRRIAALRSNMNDENAKVLEAQSVRRRGEGSLPWLKRSEPLLRKVVIPKAMRGRYAFFGEWWLLENARTSTFSTTASLVPS